MKFSVSLVLFFASLFGQQVDYKVKGGQTDIYTDAVEHYIDSVYSKDQPVFDTLFILKNEDFTRFVLPALIKNLAISFQDSAGIARRLKYKKQIRALNIAADENLGKERINIGIVSFLVSAEKGYKSTKSCRIRYFYNVTKKEFEFKSIVCDY